VEAWLEETTEVDESLTIDDGATVLLAVDLVSSLELDSLSFKFAGEGC